MKQAPVEHAWLSPVTVPRRNRLPERDETVLPGVHTPYHYY